MIFVILIYLAALAFILYLTYKYYLKYKQGECGIVSVASLGISSGVAILCFIWILGMLSSIGDSYHDDTDYGNCSICGIERECYICGESGLYCQYAEYGKGERVHYCKEHCHFIWE